MWDQSIDPPIRRHCSTFFWDGQEDDDFNFSLLKYIERNGNRLRKKYCDFIDRIGKAKVSGVTIENHLRVEGFSYWWMSLLIEKNVWKTPSIYAALRVIALEEIMENHKPLSFELVSSSSDLNEVFSNYCQKNNITYTWVEEGRFAWGLSSKLRVPHIVRGFVKFISITLTWLLFLKSRFNSNVAIRNSPDIFIFSYLNNINMKQVRTERFYTSYWGEVPQLIINMQLKINWVHHFVSNEITPNLRAAIKLINYLNKILGLKERHSLIERKISLGVIFKAFRIWVSFMIFGIKNRSIKYFFSLPNSEMSLWPILRDSWARSLYGSSAIENIFMESFIGSEISDAPQYVAGFYLCENQAWERALTYHWKKHQNKKLIAVPHSTISFWDMRFYQSESLGVFDGLTPQPNFILANGKNSFHQLAEMNYPSSMIIACEAQRYSYLNEFYPLDATLAGHEILVLGDYDRKKNERMLGVINAYIRESNNKLSIAYKPHPNNSLSLDSDVLKNYNAELRPLDESLKKYDIVIASSGTSAAVEAYLLGIKLICFLDPNTLNLSPLRDFRNIEFISNVAALNKAFEKIKVCKEDRPKDFFYFDRDYKMWRNILCGL